MPFEKSCEFQSRDEEMEWVRRVRVCVVHRLHFIARGRGGSLKHNSSTRFIQYEKKGPNNASQPCMPQISAQ